MICFEVTLNKKRLTTAGLPGYAVVTANLTWVRSRNRAPSTGLPHFEELSLRVGGLDSNQQPGTHVDWVSNGKLKVGDEIVVRVLEQETADSFSNRYKPRPYSHADHAKQLREQIAKLQEELGRVLKASPKSSTSKKSATMKIAMKKTDGTAAKRKPAMKRKSR